MEELVKDPSIQFAQDVVNKLTSNKKITVDDVNKMQLLTLASEIGSLQPYYNALNETMKTMQETYKQKGDTLDKYTEKVTPIMQEAEQVASYKIPEAPTKEQFSEPKTVGDRIFKQIIPSLLSMAAFLNPGKYGENIAMVAGLYDAFKADNKEKYEQALKEWQLKTETELKNRELKLKALDYKLKSNDLEFKTELEKLGINVEMLKTQLATQLEGIKSIRENFKAIRDTFQNIGKNIIEKEKISADLAKTRDVKAVTLFHPSGKEYQIPANQIDKINEYLAKGWTTLKPTDVERTVRSVKEEKENNVGKKDAQYYYKESKLKPAVDYVRQMVRAGYSTQNIVDNLAKQGWKEEDIYRAIQLYTEGK